MVSSYTLGGFLAPAAAACRGGVPDPPHPGPQPGLMSSSTARGHASYTRARVSVPAGPRDSRRAGRLRPRWRVGCTWQLPPRRGRGEGERMGRLGFLALPAMLVLAGASMASAQALADPGRSADATFLAKASEATALDAELAHAWRRHGRRAPPSRRSPRQVLDAGAALDRELTAMAKARRIRAGTRARRGEARGGTAGRGNPSRLRCRVRRRDDCAPRSRWWRCSRPSRAMDATTRSRSGRPGSCRRCASTSPRSAPCGRACARTSTRSVY